MRDLAVSLAFNHYGQAKQNLDDSTPWWEVESPLIPAFRSDVIQAAKPRKLRGSTGTPAQPPPRISHPTQDHNKRPQVVRSHQRCAEHRIPPAGHSKPRRSHEREGDRERSREPDDDKRDTQEMHGRLLVEKRCKSKVDAPILIGDCQPGYCAKITSCSRYKTVSSTGLIARSLTSTSPIRSTSTGAPYPASATESIRMRF